MPPMVTNETLAAILQRVEASLTADVRRVEQSLDALHGKVERLDDDVRSNYVQRPELKNYVTVERYIWVERVVIGLVSIILVGALTLVGNAILTSLK